MEDDFSIKLEKAKEDMLKRLSSAIEQEDSKVKLNALLHFAKFAAVVLVALTKKP